MAFDPRAEDPLVVIDADSFLTVISDPLSKKCGNVIRFHRKDCGFDNLIIKRSQVVRLFGRDISRALNCCWP